ncbi:MAG: hypothetical protein K2H85_09045, partial [Allobaculum sp.]|nr:hypothetical protein [Allobaculum sp.]
LNTLDISGNKLYQLDTTGAKRLNNLNANGNQIYELKVGSALETLLANHNKLSEFDASGLKDLISLDLSNNMLKSVKLPTKAGEFTNLQLQKNHLASLNLKNVNFGDPKLSTETVFGNPEYIQVSPQNLYANSTDNAVNIKEYDPNFDPDNATLSNGNDFNSNGNFDISGLGPVGTKAQFTDAATRIFVTIGNDGKIANIVVTLHGTEVPSSAYTLNPQLKVGEAIPALPSGKITVTANSNSAFVGTATVEVEYPATTVSGIQAQVQAKLAAGITTDEIRVYIDPKISIPSWGTPLENPQYEVEYVQGTAQLGNQKIYLIFQKDLASDPSGFTWVATPQDSYASQPGEAEGWEAAELREVEALTTWNVAPTQVRIEGEFSVTDPALAGPVTCGFEMAASDPALTTTLAPINTEVPTMTPDESGQPTTTVTLTGAKNPSLTYDPETGAFTSFTFT